MNTKIYFNNRCLEFKSSLLQESENQSIRFYNEMDEKKLNSILEELLSENISGLSEHNTNYIISDDYLTFVLEYLKKNLHYIEAAGGLIQKKTEFLFIYRLGKWDLPKGKLDKGETIEHAAIRECEEECAVKNLKIEKQLFSTYHVYKYKKKIALKQTYWFYMTTDYAEQLIPQVEENIEEVKWFTSDEIKKTVFANSYFTIIDVVTEFLKLTKT